MTKRPGGASPPHLPPRVTRPNIGSVNNGYQPKLESPARPMPSSIPNPGPSVQPPSKPKDG